MSYFCRNCGYTSPKWMGKCPRCEEWNTFEERSEEEIKEVFSFPPLSLKELEEEKEKRITLPLEEFNRVLGGGIVRGAVILIGGEPGIGKSTLLCQIARYFPGKILYVSGEESPYQIKLRCSRLGVSGENIFILAETILDNVLKHLQSLEPDLVMIDSIQSIYHTSLPSPPGSVAQVRECAGILIKEAKSRGIPLIITGQVTKEGIIAGPKVLEHLVDVVLYLEGERRGIYRILRGIKNRFGPSQETGIFQMTEKGLEEVRNPSSLFLSDTEFAPGTVVVPIEEGTRILLVEIQALLTSTPFHPPRRHITGMDINRSLLLLAVLEKRLGIPLHRFDVFVNVVGGLKIQETAADLGFALAIYSAWKNISLSRWVIMGEVGLGGEIRRIPRPEKRVEEGKRLGFRRFILPPEEMKKVAGIEIIKVRNLKEAVKLLKEKG